MSPQPRGNALGEKAFALAPLVILGLAVWLIYGRAIGFPFIFDDALSITENPSIVRLWPLVGNAEHRGPLNPPKELPTSGRPLVNFTLALNYHFGKLDPAGYHRFNLIVHLLSALLLMAIVRRVLQLDFFRGRFNRVCDALALAAALLWAVHPLQTETVVYVTQRTELLVGFFYLATLYGSLRYWAAESSAGQKTWLALTTLAGFAGMASKEVMVTAPVIVLLFERTFIVESFRKAVQKSWPLYVGLALGWALLLGLNYNGPRSVTAGFHSGLPATDWWFTQSKMFWMYLKLAIWPWPLAIHYQTPYLTTFAAVWPWLVTLALLGIVTLILFWRRNAVGFVGVWVLVILSPTLVVPILSEAAAERRMYLPLAALVTLAVAGGYALALRLQGQLTAKSNGALISSKPAALTCGVAFILAMVWSLVDVRRLAAYQTELSLWQDEVVYQPNDSLAHNNLGLELVKAGKLQEAMNHYQKALQLRPDDPDTNNNLGNELLTLGRVPEAIAHLEQALQWKPSFAKAHNNLGTALKQSGQLPAAIKQYEQALQIRPEFVEAHYNLANAFAKTGRTSDAIEQYQHALQIKPDFAEARNNLASALVEAGRPEEAILQLQQVLQIKPQDATIYANLAKIYAQLHRSQEAIAAAQQGLDKAKSAGQTALAAQVEEWLANYRKQQNNP